MAYIGREPTVGNFQVCDAISVVNGQAAYTMQVGSANVSPESANHMIVSLSGVIQKPGSSYTVSGSTITFSQNLVTGDVIDFIQILGNVLDIGTPSDATVTTAKLANSAVDLTSKVTGALPVANGGTNLTSGFANGITEADFWRLTANLSSNTNPIASNLERVDDASFSKIGTGMSVSSGYWSFPSTGLYEVTATMNSTGASADNHIIRIHVTTDNSNYDPVSNVVSASTDSQHEQASCFAFVNVTNTTNVKLFFEATSIGSGSIQGDTDVNYTCFKFIRLGDSQ